jgi:hypothetical protein
MVTNGVKLVALQITVFVLVLQTATVPCRRRIHIVISVNLSKTLQTSITIFDSQYHLSCCSLGPSLTGYVLSFTTAVAMDIAYGYEIAESNDHFVILAETTVNKGTAAFYPAAYYVNMIPWRALSCFTSVRVNSNAVII